MWMRKTAHSHSLSFLFFSFLPKTHDGGCAIVRPGCRVFFFFQNTYKKAPPAQEISPARKEPYCFFTVILWSQPAGKRIIHTPKQDWNASVPKPPSWREVAFASANDGGSYNARLLYHLSLCEQTGGLVLSGVSAVRGSAPERFSFAYFSFPQKEK